MAGGSAADNDCSGSSAVFRFPVVGGEESWEDSLSDCVTVVGEVTLLRRELPMLGAGRSICIGDDWIVGLACAVFGV